MVRRKEGTLARCRRRDARGYGVGKARRETFLRRVEWSEGVGRAAGVRRQRTGLVEARRKGLDDEQRATRRQGNPLGSEPTEGKANVLA